MFSKLKQIIIKTIKIILKLVWWFVVIFAFLCTIAFFRYSIIGGLLLLITSVLTIPKIYLKVKNFKLLNFKFSNITLIPTIIALFIGGMLVIVETPSYKSSIPKKAEPVLPLADNKKNINQEEQNKIDQENKNKELEKQKLDKAKEIEVATKVNDQITFDSEVASQDIQKSVESNKAIAELGLSTIDKKSFKVLSIIDGDNVNIESIGNVRLIGIDAPEIKDPRTTVQCFGAESAEKLKSIINNEEVYLEFDPSNRIDKYGRTLAYITKKDKTDVNLKMILDGYAFAYKTYPHSRLENYTNNELEAKNKQNGLWSNTTCNGEKKNIVVAPIVVEKVAPPPATNTILPIISAPPVTPKPDVPPPPVEYGCEKGYPDFCVPKGLPDIDCPDIKRRMFTVTAPDVHGFDSDSDGLGCETKSTKWNGTYSF